MPDVVAAEHEIRTALETLDLPVHVDRWDVEASEDTSGEPAFYVTAWVSDDADIDELVETHDATWHAAMDARPDRDRSAWVYVSFSTPSDGGRG